LYLTDAVIYPPLAWQIILNKLRDDFSSVLFQFLVFYISGCPRSGLPVQFKSLLQLILQKFLQIEVLANLVLGQAPAVAQECSSESSLIESAAAVLQSQVCTIATSVYEIGNLLTCANWNSLYATVMYDAVCYNATTGFAWIATTQFLIVLFSMIMLTLRVGFYEIEDEEEYDRHRRCCCGNGEQEATEGEALKTDQQEQQLGQVDIEGDKNERHMSP